MTHFKKNWVTLLKYRPISLVMILFYSHISGVIVTSSMLASSVVDLGFEPRFVNTKGYKIGICCSSTKE